ncbi:type II toxin-antitoxin system death-on-curing family toxin [Rufibacter sp. XAAS-G3-1]|uniref:type II toxin-antitoxin system death-on-curing family toxin n=1 Tax=Rufibacter sp. XAAS-G3-1 TaxID=2729134 RepID=UPI0015E7C500|nr:type II toxin-antitoxin system death-on-curing family toxin [Rufibacter sp. XAAS-G3-1]
MISLREVDQIHTLLIEEFGGAKGIRDEEALDAALHRPYATFDQQELYPTPADKAAALIESILLNHPFIDGNKRTGYVLMRLLLLQSALDLQATQEEKYAFVISIATGERSFDGIKKWIEEKTVPSPTS